MVHQVILCIETHSLAPPSTKISCVSLLFSFSHFIYTTASSKLQVNFSTTTTVIKLIKLPTKMSATPLRAALATARARRNAFSFSTQKRTLFFCGPKPSDHDATHPITEHYRARQRSNSDAVYIGESLMAAAARAQSPSRVGTVVAQTQSPPKASFINKVSATESHLASPFNAAAITNTLEATIVTLGV